MIKLNIKEKRIYDYIRTSIEENGYSPSVRDIREALGYKSTSTVHMYLERLESLGYIQKENGKSRSLRINDDNNDRIVFTCVPLIGKVTAGIPILAVENYEGCIGFDAGKYDKDMLFALRVSGTSMIDAGILDGDTVIVEKCDYADNGTIVVALVDDEATVKRFYKEKGGYRLQPENPDMKPILIKDDRSLSILGRVVAVQRLY